MGFDGKRACSAHRESAKPLRHHSSQQWCTQTRVACHRRLKSAEWDISFLGLEWRGTAMVSSISPRRFLVVELGYLVPGGSPISTMAGVDRPEIRDRDAPQGGSVNATRECAR